MSAPRLVMAGGGTAGHLFPCVAVAEEVEALAPEARVRFVGARGRIDERILAERQLSHSLIDARPLPYRPSLEALRGLVALPRSVGQSRRIIRDCRPHAIFSTGGYVGAAVGLAARIAGVPLVLHASDVTPDRANRLLARWAAAITTVSAEAAEALSPKAVVTGNPVRAEVADATPEDAVRELGIEADLLTILVTGGSQGARRLNTAVIGALPELLERVGVQVVHLSGSLDYGTLRQEAERLGAPERYHLIEHLPNPGPALAAADLAVTRAGAGSLAELCLHGVPMIVVPYPFAGGHQRLNAEPLAEAGAAVIVEDEQFTAERLLALVREILGDEERRRRMAEAALAAARPSAAAEIAGILLQVAGAEAARP
ncbi:MAG: undecaprenyldiphospho-muramoylpentapeptide beta-N-acetylglucosaminyltransferase [Armatimonadota bacterium]|nr:undecaprenyldiphospho-muramoylpentapeptide beta-N-acetylglucosaminyltransferase [Armatimonadota bacterium]